MRTIIAAALAVAAAIPAQAQYYERPPPYYPPSGYDRPPAYYERQRFGRRCDAVLRTPYGPQSLVCPIIEPKPLGMECACPPPEGYPQRRYIPGRTIR